MVNPNLPAAIDKNPLNLRPLPNGEKWNGQTGANTFPGSGTFCAFSDNAHGVRAAVINMRSIVRLGRNTIEKMINTWAPPGADQNAQTVSNYVKAVCDYAQLDPSYDLSWLSAADASTSYNARDTLAMIVEGMNRFEAGGETITADEAHQGIDLAIGSVPAGYVRQDDGNVKREFLAQSETVQSANLGIVNTVTGAVATAGVPLVSAAAGASWQLVTIFGLVGVFALAGLAVYALIRVKQERAKMHEAGIA